MPVAGAVVTSVRGDAGKEQSTATALCLPVAVPWLVLVINWSTFREGRPHGTQSHATEEQQRSSGMNFLTSLWTAELSSPQAPRTTDLRKTLL